MSDPHAPDRSRMWQVPSLRTDEEEGRHRKVTWLELFFDLVFVVAVAQAAHLVALEPSWTGLGKFVAVFLPVFWTWNAATYYNERFETEGLETRLFAFLQMLVVAGLAINAHHAIGDTYAGFVLAYAAGRAVNVTLWIRAARHVPAFWPSALRFGLGGGSSIVLMTASLWLEGPARYILYAVALAADILAPLATIGHNRTLPSFSTSKLPERFGLFAIIVLGEAIVGTINGLSEVHHWTLTEAFAGVLGLGIGYSLWWIYFDFAARRVPRASTHAVFAWTYLHMALLMALTTAGASLLPVIRSLGVVAFEIRLLFAIAVGAAVIVVGLLEKVLERAPDEPTHTWAPWLLVAVGLGVIAVGHAPVGPIGLMGLTQALLVIPAVYGLSVWFGFFPGRARE